MKHAYQKKSNTNSNEVIHHDSREQFRLNKYISDSSYCSRREADRLIENQCVTIDGKIASIGMQVHAQQIVKVHHTTITRNKNLKYIALNKPIGITCTTDTSIEGNLSNFMNLKEHIFPIGRLDKDSSGLILLTNDGDVVNKILRSENHHEKEYIVHVNKKIDSTFKSKMESGVIIYNTVRNTHQKTKTCKVKILTPTSFSLILSEGMNRQIRRMCKELGYKVYKLHRIRIMNIQIDDLQKGEYRYLSKDEIVQLSN